MSESFLGRNTGMSCWVLTGVSPLAGLVLACFLKQSPLGPPTAVLGSCLHPRLRLAFGWPSVPKCSHDPCTPSLGTPLLGLLILSGSCSPRCSVSESYSSLGASKAILAFGSHSCPPRKSRSPITCDEEAFSLSQQLQRQVPCCQARLLFADDSICHSKGPALGGQWVGGRGCEPDSRGHVEKAAQRGGTFQPLRLLGCNFLR